MGLRQGRSASGSCRSTSGVCQIKYKLIHITLLTLPPYSPELNPVERIWHYLRSHWLANSVSRSLADITDACETAWNRFAADHALIRSLCTVRWASASPAQ